jgi:ribosomal protein L11 methyltransferase
VPYRVDFRNVGADALDRLVELGALDAELSDGGIAALMPDSATPEQLASALGVDDISVSSATGRDAESVWVLSRRPIRMGRLRIVPAHIEAEPGALRLIDAAAFGTGLHPTTALCLEALEEAVKVATPDAVLDVGTGTGILALAALMMGVPRALGIDIDRQALRVAAENARVNALNDRLQLTLGGPEAVTGTWPLILANVLAASLIEMAPALVRRVGHHGQLGLRRVRVRSRAGWIALVLQATW